MYTCICFIVCYHFSHPSVDGMMLGGFWDKHHSVAPEAALFDGADFTVSFINKNYGQLSVPNNAAISHFC